MHIRPAVVADISTCADFSVTAFWDDDLFIKLHPHRQEYPECFRDHFLHKHLCSFYSSGVRMLVVVPDEGDEGYVGKNTPVALAIWERFGKSKVARQWQRQSWASKIEHVLRKTEMRYHKFVRSDKSEDPARVKEILGNYESSFTSIGEFWHLNLLVINPAFQRRGIGSMLLEWGFEQARREKVPVGLEASPMGEGLYRKKGFKDYGSTQLGPSLLWKPDI